MGKVDVNGRDLDYYMMKILTERGYSFAGIATVMTRDVIHKLGYVAKDFDAEMKKNEKEIEASYELPDGQIITVSRERFRVAEPLFNPGLIGKKCDGLAVALNKCVDACADDMRHDLLSNIIFCGGNTMFDGIINRMYPC